MDDKDNNVVNTEEQNRAVNPGTGDFQEISPKNQLEQTRHCQIIKKKKTNATSQIKASVLKNNFRQENT
jgi:hypothetical protein